MKDLKNTQNRDTWLWPLRALTIGSLCSVWQTTFGSIAILLPFLGVDACVHGLLVLRTAIKQKEEKSLIFPLFVIPKQSKVIPLGFTKLCKYTLSLLCYCLSSAFRPSGMQKNRFWEKFRFYLRFYCCLCCPYLSHCF